MQSTRTSAMGQPPIAHDKITDRSYATKLDTVTIRPKGSFESDKIKIASYSRIIICRPDLSHNIQFSLNLVQLTKAKVY